MKHKYLVIVYYDCCDGKCSGCYSAGKGFFEYETLEQVLEKTIECRKQRQKYKIYKQINIKVTEQDFTEELNNG